jgi:hypothetical protein
MERMLYVEIEDPGFSDTIDLRIPLLGEEGNAALLVPW